MKHTLYILTLLVTLVSCSKYQKALKSENIAEKYAFGVALYEEGKFKKANKLFVQIVPNYRGKPQAEKLMFLYADTFYQMEEDYLAAYQFETFTTAYPQSDNVEEAAYKSAESYYKLSPVYSKNQEETIHALEKLQLFANIYPNSEYLPKVNALVKELDFKLEKKAFEIAKQYNRITDYKASIKSFNNFLRDFPGSSLKEQALNTRAEAAYTLAVKSVSYKQQERFETAKEYYQVLNTNFPNSENKEDTESLLIEIDEQIKQNTSKS
jgi:outer membrane protein assembly factor BamD